MNLISPLASGFGVFALPGPGDRVPPRGPRDVLVDRRPAPQRRR